MTAQLHSTSYFSKSIKALALHTSSLIACNCHPRSPKIMSFCPNVFQVKSSSNGTSVKLRDSQLNTETLGKFFNLFPQSIFLIADDGSVATPDSQTGEFDTYDINSDIVWTINGDTTKPASAAIGQVGEILGKPGTSYAYQQPSTEAGPSSSHKRKWKPRYTSTVLKSSGYKPPGATKPESSKKPGRQVGEIWTKTIEICTYEDSIIKKTFNLPISLSEKGSTVSGVAAVVASEAFGEEPVVLLDADNLVIPDSGGTRGM